MFRRIFYNLSVEISHLVPPRTVTHLFNASMMGCVPQWEACLTRNCSVVSSNPIKGFRYFIEQETLPSLLSPGLFKERIQEWFLNRT